MSVMCFILSFVVKHAITSCVPAHSEHLQHCSENATVPSGGQVLYGCQQNQLSVGTDTSTALNVYLFGDALNTCNHDGRWDHPAPSCRPLDCVLPGSQVRFYNGAAHQTPYGTCLRWDQISHHESSSHPASLDINFPGGSLTSAANQCRSPDVKRRKGTWCYVACENKTCPIEETRQSTSQTQTTSQTHSREHSSQQATRHIIVPQNELQSDLAVHQPSPAIIARDTNETQPTVTTIITTPSSIVATQSVSTENTSTATNATTSAKLNTTKATTATPSPKYWAYCSVRKCVLKQCTVLKVPHTVITAGKNASSATQVDFGNFVRYQCETGYQRTCGDELLYCSFEGLWVGLPPLCTPVPCMSQTLMHGMAKPSLGREVPVGTRIRYSCQKGYTLEGSNKEFTCILGPKWSPDDQMPTCTPLSFSWSTEAIVGIVTGALVVIACAACILCILRKRIDLGVEQSGARSNRLRKKWQKFRTKDGSIYSYNRLSRQSVWGQVVDSDENEPEWTIHRDSNDREYYMNQTTGEKRWSPPAKLKSEHWTRNVDKSGDVFYRNILTDETFWEPDTDASDVTGNDNGGWRKLTALNRAFLSNEVTNECFWEPGHLWSEQKTDQGLTYYFDHVTGKSIWATEIKKLVGRNKEKGVEPVEKSGERGGEDSECQSRSQNSEFSSELSSESLSLKSANPN